MRKKTKAGKRSERKLIRDEKWEKWHDISDDDEIIYAILFYRRRSSHWSANVSFVCHRDQNWETGDFWMGYNWELLMVSWHGARQIECGEYVRNQNRSIIFHLRFFSKEKSLIFSNEEKVHMFEWKKSHHQTQENSILRLKAEIS